MSYIGGYHDKQRDIVHIAERINGKRVLVEHRPIYNFYIQDARGKHRSTHGESVSEIRCKNGKDFQKNLAMYRHTKTFESDIKAINKVLESHYLNQEPPQPNVAFFDIEVAFDPERGYSQPEEAFMPITSVGVYMQWCKQMVCLAVPPPTLTYDQAKKQLEGLDDVILCENEKQLLEVFLEIIGDADILSGWNSEGYDIPYTVNRIAKVLGKSELRRLCLWDQMPKERTYTAFGNDRQTFDLVGRVHLDYLQLYKKYNYEERHSYRLDFIGEMEVGERKVVYDGTLDHLYNYDFRKFVEYNIQDVMLLDKLDRKLQFIDLANSIAHDNTVLMPTVMGAVATTDQAIINECHRRGRVVPDRVRSKDSGQAAGAYVAFPKRGFHEWIGSMDLNSLYPSVFRALNMAPETIVGQVRPTYTQAEIDAKIEGKWIPPGEKKPHKKMSFADAWLGKFGTNEFEMITDKDSHHTLKLDMVDGESLDVTGAEIYHLVFNSDQPWNISANGTIFRTDEQGIVPGLLERWYAERKILQAKKSAWETVKGGMEVGHKHEDVLRSLVPESDLRVENGLIVYVGKLDIDAEISFWDKRQLVKKINLNSLYGAILNVGCRFYDQRVGQSTTLTGRRITRHMAAEANKMLTGDYDHEGKCIIYGDTDSTYFTAVPVLPEGSEFDLDKAVDLYDYISDTVSSTFPEFLNKTFGIPLEAGQVMKAGREVVGRAGVFIVKKRYAINVLDIEGYRPPGGKLKAMGLDIKRSDTPEYIQDFLEEVLTDALSAVPESDVIAKIRRFKEDFQNLDPWKKGMPKAVNNLTKYTDQLTKKENAIRIKNNQRTVQEVESITIPGHVRASINWNRLKKMHSDQYSMNITDGQKVIVCRLKDNPMGYTSVAYPVDEMHIPEWFKDLPFDNQGMEEAVLNKKITNVLGAMGWDLTKIHHSKAQDKFFDFG
jgi:DNA polymerase elongation subunit (family B)